MPDPPFPSSPPPPAVAGWRDRLTLLRGMRPAVPGPVAAAGAALAALAVAVVVVVLFLRSPSPAPALVLPRAAPPSAPPSGAVPAADVRVHVAGAVARPGVYRVADGGRVADLLDAAGGPAPEADLDRVNLAARVGDGERVYLPRRGEPEPAAAGAGAVAAAATAAGPVDLNVATAGQLDELPGVGPATAEAIVTYRDEHGRFGSVEELIEVRGIGEAKLAALRPRVRV